MNHQWNTCIREKWFQNKLNYRSYYQGYCKKLIQIEQRRIYRSRRGKGNGGKLRKKWRDRLPRAAGAVFASIRSANIPIKIRRPYMAEPSNDVDLLRGGGRHLVMTSTIHVTSTYFPLLRTFNSHQLPTGILFGGRVQQIQLRTEDREKGGLGAVAP